MADLLATLSSLTWPGAFAIVGVAAALAYAITR